MALERGWLGFAAGLLLFLFPGFAWAFAFARGLDVPKRVALGFVLSFTVAPAAMFVLNLLFGVPIRLGTIAFLSLALGLVGVSVMVGRFVLGRLAEA